MIYVSSVSQPGYKRSVSETSEALYADVPGGDLDSSHGDDYAMKGMSNPVCRVPAFLYQPLSSPLSLLVFQMYNKIAQLRDGSGYKTAEPAYDRARTSVRKSDEPLYDRAKPASAGDEAYLDVLVPGDEDPKATPKPAKDSYFYVETPGADNDNDNNDESYLYVQRDAAGSKVAAAAAAAKDSSGRDGPVSEHQGWRRR